MPRKPKAQLMGLPAIPAKLPEPFSDGPMTAEAINGFARSLFRVAAGRVQDHQCRGLSEKVSLAPLINQGLGHLFRDECTLLVSKKVSLIGKIPR